MTRVAVVVALAGGLLGTMPAAHAARGPCAHRWFTEPDPSPEHVRVHQAQALIGCVFRHGGLAREIPEAFCIARYESGYQPGARSPADDRGMFQHRADFWAGRVRELLPRWSFPGWPHVSAFNALANTWVTREMVRGGGWSPWSTRWRCE